MDSHGSMKKKMLLQMNAKILKIHKDKMCAFCRTIAVLCIGPHRVNVGKRLFELAELSLAVMK
jgi:hypothetical protein